MEDDGFNFEHELKKWGCKDYEKIIKENALIAKSFDILVEKLKKKIIKDILMFQNEENLEVKEARQEVDIHFF